MDKLPVELIIQFLIKADPSDLDHFCSVDQYVNSICKQHSDYIIRSQIEKLKGLDIKEYPLAEEFRSELDIPELLEYIQCMLDMNKDTEHFLENAKPTLPVMLSLLCLEGTSRRELGLLPGKMRLAFRFFKTVHFNSTIGLDELELDLNFDDYTPSEKDVLVNTMVDLKDSFVLREDTQVDGLLLMLQNEIKEEPKYTRRLRKVIYHRYALEDLPELTVTLAEL